MAFGISMRRVIVRTEDDRMIVDRGTRDDKVAGCARASGSPRESCQRPRGPSSALRGR
jgi:hypothetical protein